MDIFYYQLVASFLAGGTIIASLSFFSEKLPKNSAGIVMSLPSTLAISFIFLGLIEGVENLKESISGVPLSLLGASIFCFMWAVLAENIFKNKTIKHCLITFFLSIFAWLTIPILMIFYGKPDLLTSLFLFGIGTTLFQWIFWKIGKNKPEPKKIYKITIKEWFLRIIFAGSVVSMTLIIAKNFGVFWGVIFGSSFPAAYSSQLLILQHRLGGKFIWGKILLIPLGIISLLSYALSAMILFPILGIWIGTMACYGISFIVSWIIFRITMLLKLVNETPRS